jgi:deazaflavin-dependent oxidoreductase (nitroreductase family)
MASWQWFGRLHARIFRATKGRLGGNLIGMPVLLLTTTGRKSGQARTTPMPFYTHGDDFVIVGSNNGEPRDPAWWLNLQADARAEIQVRGDEIAVRGRLAEPDERARLWPELLAFNPRYAVYEKRTTREIPVVILSRV